MKKINILLAVIIVAAFTFTSCNKDKVQLPKIETQADSLNYAFGLANGNIINNFYLQPYKANPDSLEAKISLLLQGIDKATKETDADKKEADNKDEIFQLGLQFGNSFKQQLKDGLLGVSTLAFNETLVRQGLINALYDFKEGMTALEAEPYLNKTMKSIIESQTVPKNIDTVAPDSISAN